LVLDIAGGVAQAGAWMVVYPTVQAPPAWQQWSAALPPFFVPKWSFIQSPLTDDQNNTYVATIQDGTSNVVLSPIQESSPNQLWQITADGRILSATEGNPIVTLGSQYDWGPNGNNIVTGSSPIHCSHMAVFLSSATITTRRGMAAGWLSTLSSLIQILDKVARLRISWPISTTVKMKVERSGSIRSRRALGTSSPHPFVIQARTWTLILAQFRLEYAWRRSIHLLPIN
jgi:hypothetical protein